jgi:tripeptide aminopeptidase
MTLVERFLKYVSFDTQSSEETGVTPSTPGQMVFARYLKEELETLGLEEITLDENGYLFATLPANTDKPLPVIGFIAHMDTSPDMSGKNVSPHIVQNYDGKDIVLCAEENVVTNDDLSKLMTTNDEWITERTGIKERRHRNNLDLKLQKR